jgi:hypothetical protein
MPECDFPRGVWALLVSLELDDPRRNREGRPNRRPRRHARILARYGTVRANRLALRITVRTAVKAAVKVGWNRDARRLTSGCGPTPMAGESGSIPLSPRGGPGHDCDRVGDGDKSPVDAGTAIVIVMTPRWGD